MDTLIARVNELSAWIVSQLALMALAGSLLIVLASIALRFYRTPSASTRHFVWLLAIVVPLLMPIASALLPRWHAGAWAGSRLMKTQPTALAAGLEGNADQGPSPEAAADGLPRKASSTATGGSTIGFTDADFAERDRDFPAVLFLSVWAAGFVVLLSRWIMGLISLRRLSLRASEPHASSIAVVLADETADLHVRRRIRVCLSSERDSPMQWGTFCPVILLPAAAMTWDRARITSVLRHELAHIIRGDCLTRAMAHLSSSLLWFNPLMWYAQRRLGRESELASDDVAINSGCDPYDYAETLLFISRMVTRPSALRLPALSMATTSMLEGRVRAILSPGLNRGSVCRRTSILFGLFAALVIGGLATLQPDNAAARMTATGAAEQPITQVADDDPTRPAGSTDRVTTLSYVDDSAEGRRSIAGSGHAVRFTCSSDASGDAGRYLVAVEIYASRYGYDKPPAEDFHIYLLDARQELIAAFPIPYATVQRGRERWYTFSIAPTVVPETFFVAFAFNPSRTKGVYVGYDAAADEVRSYVGRPTSGLEPLSEQRNWMIRAVVAAESRVCNPFD